MVTRAAQGPCTLGPLRPDRRLLEAARIFARSNNFSVQGPEKMIRLFEATCRAEYG